MRSRLHLEDARLRVRGVGDDARLRARERDRLVPEVVDDHRRQRARDRARPVESSMSISRGCGRSETSWAMATSSSVCLPRAESTATTRLPASAACTIRRAACLMRSASATEVPPNFMTTVSVPLNGMADKDSAAARATLGAGRTSSLGSWSSDAACSPPPWQSSRRARRVRRCPGGCGPDRQAGASRAGRQRRSSWPGSCPAPAPGEGARPGGPARIPRGARGLIAGMSVERKVAQLFLFGFEGTDLNAEIFERLRRQDLGGLVIGRDNYTTSDALGQLAGEARVIAADEGHVPAVRDGQPAGGELNSFPDLPPASNAGRRCALPRRRATPRPSPPRALSNLGVNGVLGPILDVGVEGGSALGTATYSDDPAEVSAFADSVLRAYSDAGVFTAAAHFPGLGSADQPTEERTRHRRPRPPGAAGAATCSRSGPPWRTPRPGLLLSNALYPMNDFTAPASLSPEVASEPAARRARIPGRGHHGRPLRAVGGRGGVGSPGGGGGRPRRGGHAPCVGTSCRSGGGVPGRSAGRAAADA